MRARLAVLAVLCLAPAAGAAPQSLSGVATSLEKEKAAVREASARIEELRRTRDGLRSSLRANQENLAALRENYASLERALSAQEQNLDEAGTYVAAVRKGIVRGALLPGKRGVPFLPFLTRSFAHGNRVLSALEEARRDGDRERETLLRNQEEVARLLERGKGQLASVASSLEEQSWERERHRRRLASLQKVFAELKVKLASGSGLRRSLSWPIEGKAAKASPELKGILILPADAGPVRAVAAGEVVYTDALPGLGKVVVLQHGDYFTVYGNLSAVTAPPKGSVDTGEPIGSLEKGLDGQMEGLYFEVRHHDRALDPREWLASGPAQKAMAR